MSFVLNGTPIKLYDYYKLIGKKTKKTIYEDDVICYEDIEW